MLAQAGLDSTAWQVVGMIAAAALLGGSALLVNIALTTKKIAAYVLPHFEPPPPGGKDQSLPARVSRMEEAMLKQQDHDHRIEKLEDQLANLHAQLISALSAGNPEIRQIHIDRRGES